MMELNRMLFFISWLRFKNENTLRHKIWLITNLKFLKQRLLEIIRTKIVHVRR
jgi:hypothetical protein